MLILFNVPVSAKQTVYISEVNFAGSVRSDCNLCSYDKWIELTNPSEKAIDVSSWQLRFRESQAATNNLKFPPNTFIQAKSNYLVRNRYNGLVSTLSNANIQADAISGKVLRVSSNQSGQRKIQASLHNNSGQNISEINLNEQNLVFLEQAANLEASAKYSLSYNLASVKYEISTPIYFQNNYGSPKAGTGNLVDLDDQQLSAEVQPVLEIKPEVITPNPVVNVVQAPAQVVVEVPVPTSQVTVAAPVLSIEPAEAELPSKQIASNTVTQTVTEAVPAIKLPQVVTSEATNSKVNSESIAKDSFKNVAPVPAALPDIISQKFIETRSSDFTTQVYQQSSQLMQGDKQFNKADSLKLQPQTKSVFNASGKLDFNLANIFSAKISDISVSAALSEINLDNVYFQQTETLNSNQLKQGALLPVSLNTDVKNQSTLNTSYAMQKPSNQFIKQELDLNLWPLVLILLASVLSKQASSKASLEEFNLRSQQALAVPIWA